jgi:hypothetical protein
MVESFD